ncbi:MAG: hypothetical protein HC774_06925, partial [Sphingomonadales bacterium]|nr:hypothetical protein [Sphingomonadales bacterium]
MQHADRCNDAQEVHDTLTDLTKGTPAWFILAARALPVGVLGQFALAGAALFMGSMPWTWHTALGTALALPVLALVGGILFVQRLRGFNWWAGLCLLLYVGQIALAAGQSIGTASIALALHPFNGALLLAASLVLLA